MNPLSPLPKTGNLTERIAALAARDIPLKLSGTYKGVILSQELRILDVQTGYIVLESPHHRICAALSSRVILQSPYLASTLFAYLLDLNVWTGKLTVTNLVETGKSWVERRSERVQPKDPIHTKIRGPKIAQRGGIQNISITGVGTLVYHSSSREEAPAPNSSIHLEFELPRTAESMMVKGIVANATRLPNRMTRLGVQMFPNIRQTHQLENYVEYRRVEILTELDRACVAALEPRPTKDLFF